MANNPLAPAAPVPTTPISVTPPHVPSAFGVVAPQPADYRGGPWIEIGRDAPASNAELMRREVAKRTRPTPRGR